MACKKLILDHYLCVGKKIVSPPVFLAQSKQENIFKVETIYRGLNKSSSMKMGTKNYLRPFVWYAYPYSFIFR